MDEEYYESPEESEARFEGDHERWENEPSYMLVSLEHFTGKPTAIGAKCLWLKYTEKGEGIPCNVMEEMIRAIKDDIDLYKFDGHIRRNLPGVRSVHEIEEPVYSLLRCAKENPGLFWRIIYPFPGNECFHLYPDWLLDNLRAEFPKKRHLKSEELYEFFGKQLGIGSDGEEDIEKGGNGVGERMRDRYRKTYMKKLKRFEGLFKQ